MKNFSSYLKFLLTKKKYTKARLARELDLKRQNYINNVIAGLHTPTLERVEQIAEILECTAEEKEQLIDLAISERRTKKAHSIRPLYPFLRKLLLDHYTENPFDEGIEKPASFDKIKKEFAKTPFHQIEKFLLEESTKFLIEKMKLRPIGSKEWIEAGEEASVNWRRDPLEYFLMFTNKGKKKKLEQVGLIWAYYPNRNVVACKIADGKLKHFEANPSVRSTANSYYIFKAANNIQEISTDEILDIKTSPRINKGLLEALVFEIKGAFMDPIAKDGQRIMLFYSHNIDDFKAGDYAIISLKKSHGIIGMHENRLYKILNISKNGALNVQDVKGKSKFSFTAAEIDIKARLIGILF
jgi:transcriptional regulator with XRE-family HTH domain